MIGTLMIMIMRLVLQPTSKTEQLKGMGERHVCSNRVSLSVEYV